MPQTLAEAQARKAALPGEISAAKSAEAAAFASFQSAKAAHQAAMHTTAMKEEEYRVVRRHIEVLTGAPA